MQQQAYAFGGIGHFFLPESLVGVRISQGAGECVFAYVYTEHGVSLSPTPLQNIAGPEGAGP